MEYCGEVLSTTLFHKRTAEYSAKKSKHFYFMSLKSTEVNIYSDEIAKRLFLYLYREANFVCSFFLYRKANFVCSFF
jgi:hypothetical protein